MCVLASNVSATLACVHDGSAADCWTHLSCSCVVSRVANRGGAVGVCTVGGGSGVVDNKALLKFRLIKNTKKTWLG